MMKKSKKMLICMFAFFMTVLLLPVTARAAVTDGGGEGTEADPRVLTVGYGDDTFSYTGIEDEKYYNHLYLRVSFADPAEVTMSTEGGNVTYKREASDTYKQGISHSEVRVRKSDTILVCITRGTIVNGTQGTLKITSKAIDISGEDAQGRSQTYCPKNISGVHSFRSGQPCDYCGFECTHPKDERDYDGCGYDQAGAGYHCARFCCKVCEAKLCKDLTEKVKCTYDRYEQDSYDVHRKEHDAHCAVCGSCTTQKCVYKSTYKKSTYAKHIHTKTCTLCGGNGGSVPENHKFKNNKCKICGFKRVIPGKPRIVSVKQKGKKKKKTRVEEAHWEDRGATTYWIPRKKYTYYEYTLTFSAKASKTKYFEVTAGTDNVTQKVSSKKKTSTYRFTSVKPIRKITFYVMSVSSSGTPGKRVKKVVKLK